MRDETFTSTQIQRRAKVNNTNLNHWSNLGVIQPIQDVRGRGKSRRFSYQNLLEVLVCRELHSYGIGSDTIRRILRDLRKRSPNAWELLRKQTGYPIYLVINRVLSFNSQTRETAEVWYVWDLKLAETPEKLGQQVGKWVSCITINMSELIREADEG